MKIQTLAVLACAASLFAQTETIPCRASLNDALKNYAVRDAASDRLYAITEARVQNLEGIAKDKRQASELKACSLSVEIFKAEIVRATLAWQYAAVQKEISQVRNDLIASYISENASLIKNMEIERSLLTESQRALAMKEYELQAQKAEAQTKLDALNSQTISVYKDARGTILSMSDILFEFGKADLKPELRENLSAIGAILQSLLTNSNIIIEGHTDNVGSAATNKKLSEQRASAVMQYLIERGIDKKRLKSVGYGLEKPVADNKTEEGRAKNRRVELVIQDKK
ncbi:MAG: OmpA family protein [Fibromonadaceae bacterium]|jgi:outer membrane protein OmpA-like peptidoglycan-associated protein|nr:OmpA family protein [Fibromonadaceae bacterium]